MNLEREEITMIGLRYRNAVLAAAMTLVAQSLSLPAQARSNPSQVASSVKEISNAEVSSLRTLSSPRNRTEASRLRRPNQQVAYTPVLILGIGW